MQILISIFWNYRETRIRALWRFSILLILMTIVAKLVQELRYSIGIFFTADNASDRLSQNLIRQIWDTVTIAIVLFFSIRWIDRRKLATLFIKKQQSNSFGLWQGAVLISFLLSIKYLIMSYVGWIEVYSFFHTTTPYSSFIKEILILLFISTFVAIEEEVLFRGYILRNLLEGFSNLPVAVNIFLSILLSSILFTLMHDWNFDMASIRYVKFLLAGIVMSVGVILSGSLLFGVGYHLAHNFVLSAMFGTGNSYWVNEVPSVFLFRFSKMAYFTTTPPVSWSDVLSILFTLFAITILIIIQRIRTGRWFKIALELNYEAIPVKKNVNDIDFRIYEK